MHISCNSFQSLVARAVLLVAILGLPAAGHDILTAEVAQEYLSAIARAYQLSRNSPSQDQQLESLYEVGSKSMMLATTLNRDVADHGASSDPKLVELILRRLGESGVVIKKEKTGFLYDFGAFKDYLKRAPKGKFAAASRLVLIRYVEVPDDRKGVEGAISEEEQFVSDFPDHPSVPYVKLQLALDHLRLSRLSSSSGGSKSGAPTEMHVRAAADILREIVKRFPDSDEAEDAREYLRSLPIQAIR